MIKAVSVTNSKNETLKLELSNPYHIGVYVDKIEGIGPEDADIITTDISSGDGGYFSGARADAREIKLTLGLMTTATGRSIEDARLLVYRYFNIKKPVALTFETDNRSLTAFGYVASNSPDIFSKEETIDITVKCPDPWFYDAGISKFAFEGIIPNFEFPFSNESVDEPLIEMGLVSLDTRADLYYEGEIDTGFVMTVHLLGPMKGLRLFNTVTYESMIVSDEMVKKLIGTGLTAGIELVISTTPGDMYAKLIKEGKEYNAVGVLNRDADWFRISNGDNIFAFSCEEGVENVQVFFSYKNRYGGV